MAAPGAPVASPGTAKSAADGEKRTASALHGSTPPRHRPESYRAGVCTPI